MEISQNFRSACLFNMRCLVSPRRYYQSLTRQAREDSRKCNQNSIQLVPATTRLPPPRFPAGAAVAKARWVEQLPRLFGSANKAVLEELKNEVGNLNISDLHRLAMAVSQFRGFSESGKLAGTELLEKIATDLEIRLLERREDCSAQQLVDFSDALCWRPKFLLVGYSLLLESHRYKSLGISDLVRMLEISCLADYRHKTLNEFVARLVAVRISGQPEISVRALAAVTRSYVSLPAWALHALVCQAQQAATTESEIASVLISLCHVDSGNFRLSGKFLDKVANISDLNQFDQQTLAGVSLALGLHGFPVKSEMARISECACMLDEADLGEEISDHRAVRVVVKPVDQWKKTKRKFWMRQRVPDFPRLVHKRPPPPQFGDREIACCVQSEIPAISDIVSRVFLTVLKSLGVTADSHGLALGINSELKEYQLAISDHTSDALAELSTNTTVSSLEAQLPDLYRKEFRAIDNRNWRGERRHLSHLSACDILAAVQLISDHLELFTRDQLQLTLLLSQAAKASISPQTRKAFTTGRKPSAEVFEVKSSLMKIAPCFGPNPQISTDQQICNFRSHLILCTL